MKRLIAAAAFLAGAWFGWYARGQEEQAPPGYTEQQVQAERDRAYEQGEQAGKRMGLVEASLSGPPRKPPTRLRGNTTS